MRSTLAMSLFLLGTLFAQPLTAGCSLDQPEFATLVGSKNHEIRGPLEIADVERDNMHAIRETGRVVPFGYANEQWVEFKAAMSAGDKVYFMVHRDGKFYLDGHILVHDGCVVRFLRGAIS